MTAELDIVQHGHAAKQRNILECASESDLGACRWVQLADVLAGKLDRTRRGAIKTGNAVEQRRLAGAVRADHRRDRSRSN